MVASLTGLIAIVRSDWPGARTSVVIGVVAYMFDLLMRWVERMLVPWKGRL